MLWHDLSEKLRKLRKLQGNHNSDGWWTFCTNKTHHVLTSSCQAEKSRGPIQLVDPGHFA